jgi:DNA-binding NarL/FixJ family response regulator
LDSGSWRRKEGSALAHTTGKVPLPVCFIEQNPLALEYLSDILEKDSSLGILRIETLAARSDKESVSPIFVVDNCGLPLPLCECLRRLQFHYPEAKYMVLDRELRKEDMFRLLCTRIEGFLSYGEVPRSLLTAIHAVALGTIWIPREILSEYVHCAREARSKSPSHLNSMTARETQILELLKRRLSNKEIADILHVQESTVKFHLSNIYSKHQVSSRRDLIQDASDRSGFGQFLPAISPSTSKA